MSRHARPKDGPVFVDPSGRRSVVVRRVGLLLGSLLVGYLSLVLLALVGPPGLSRVTVPGIGPLLPGPGAAGIDDGGRRQEPAAVMRPTPSARASTSASPSPRATGRPSPTPSVGAPTLLPSPPGRGASPSASPSASPTASPTATPTAGPPTSRPGPRRTAVPGASRRPSPKAP